LRSANGFDKISRMLSEIRIGLIGDYNEQQKAHVAIPKSLAAASEGHAKCEWVPTDSVGNGEALSEFHGLWCVPSMPYRSAEGVLRAIRYARTTGTPFLGTSAGFQYTILEFARNVLGLAEAEHQKINPKAAMPLISPLGCALVGVKARVRFMNGSVLRKAYGVPESMERYYCSFGLNSRYRRLVEGSQLCVSAVDDQNDVRAVELDGHPFFVATLFQPELWASEEGGPANPLVKAFNQACIRARDRLVTAAG
jgi:CTP synthase (UTP-ammonia lyase)